ncbi:methyltransferase type 12 [Basidiobolus meristosporus CBS 931.73]|uniref:Methyltransferase type 12 n=1 Tax=Basidiobolus meristosporus CBS 931.73 TaxID=1314790 RepID=A0A1Y1YBL8_9FUNG|nr:methyltransferase type 12 [Basidiobolus meristosporus CBS 931.73]|eukprot:ORX95441.1 methyltransferase type 12 [Basidiobolus meristosporus CBS 931.73]
MTSQEPSATQNRFDLEAEQWDTLPGMREMSEKAFLAIKAAVPLKSSMKCLEFGCGTGLVSFQIEPYVNTILGIDFSDNMVKVYNRKARESKVEDRVHAVPLILSNTDQLNGRKFDLIFSHLTYHHVEDFHQISKLLYEYLETDGYLVVTDFEKFEDSELFHPKAKHSTVEHHGILRAELLSALGEAGFKEVQVNVPFTVVRKVEGPKGEVEFPFVCGVGKKP